MGDRRRISFGRGSWSGEGVECRMRITILVAVCFVLAGSVSVPAQQPAPSAQQAVTFGFGEVSGWLTKSADLVPAEKYTYKPVNTVRSYGELIAHVADWMNWFCGSAKAG